ncbi:hypothetical protein E8E13_007880 [Curvularia kusanoi]|uniref:Uncharacterized protein n=1 Tax=Curvularia kusanoi TaxID=90978 RepID=A0A9P4TKA5_CURKU|nr:hypothetical protein E8E13_007880 [Curvularia kusanoi]
MNDILVAKIYDPVYYNPKEHADAIWSADKSHSREVAAYEHLQNITSVSDIVPAFYGAWTFNIATKAVQEGILTSSTRSIRMILMERLEGQCMEAIDPKSISDLARTTILKRCLDAEVRLHHAGVNHGDVCPRNIMVLGSSPESSDVHIKFIDFDVSLVLHHPNLEYPGVLEMQQNFSRLWSPKLSSPIVRFFGDMMEFSCRGWCPGGRRGAEQWLWQNYAHDDRYAPVQWDPNEKRKDPVYLDPLEQCHEPVSVVGHAIMTPSNSATDTCSRLNTTDDSVNKI